MYHATKTVKSHHVGGRAMKAKRGPKTCKRGEIKRSAFTRKNGTRVAATCVRDMGKPGKGKKLFTLKKGDLSKFGYSLKATEASRHRTLGKARKHFSYATLIRKLNALAILHKNTHPRYASRARSDMEYLRSTRQ